LRTKPNRARAGEPLQLGVGGKPAGRFGTKLGDIGSPFAFCLEMYPRLYFSRAIFVTNKSAILCAHISSTVPMGDARISFPPMRITARQ